MHHGFTEEHSAMLFIKLCTQGQKIQEYVKEQKALIIFDLLKASDVKKNCYGLKPEKDGYPPIDGSTDPPMSKEWVKANNKTLEKDKRKKFKTIQYQFMNK